MEEFPSFLWLSNIPVCVCVCVCVCARLHASSLSHLLMDTWIGFISLNNACVTLEFMYLSELVFSFFSGRSIHPGMELLDYMIVLFLVSLGISILLPHRQHWFILPPTPYKGFLFSISLATFVIWRLFHDSPSDKCEVNLTVVLICISWWLTVLSIFPYACWPSVYPWENVCSRLLPILKFFF